MQKREIKIEEIKSDVRKRIEECSLEIKVFMTELDLLLENWEKICGEEFFILRKEETTYEDDGNTKADGYEYEAYWVFQLNPDKKIERYAITGERVFQEEILYFKYTDKERKHDCFSSGRGRFFHLYIAGVEKPHECSIVETIDYNNDNYKLTSIINVENIFNCFVEIQKLSKRRDIIKKIITSLNNHKHQK